jgi:hypothetical protein
MSTAQNAACLTSLNSLVAPSQERVKTLVLIKAGKGTPFLSDEQFYTAGNEIRYTGAEDDAREWCIYQAHEKMVQGYYLVTVQNDFSQEWQLRAYRELADRFGYKIREINLKD